MLPSLSGPIPPRKTLRPTPDVRLPTRLPTAGGIGNRVTGRRGSGLTYATGCAAPERLLGSKAT